VIGTDVADATTIGSDKPAIPLADKTPEPKAKAQKAKAAPAPKAKKPAAKKVSRGVVTA
jgi:hypothetical protein